MKIHSLRLGHATNSSSNHSIVNMPDAKETVNDRFCFGREQFILTTTEQKNNYMAVQLFHALRPSVGERIAGLAIEQLTGVHLPIGNEDKWIGIDHQSVYNLPSTFDRSGLHVEFYEAFREFMLRDGVVILGGSDEEPSGISHPLLKQARKEYRIPVERDQYDSAGQPRQFVTRHDNKYNYWTIYNPSTGAKVRFSFDDSTEITRASRPELVDVKITDFCTKGCTYCYQGSSVTGKHADLGRILRALEELEVFEVAIGGGEPTSHPEFASFLESCAYYHVTPNFSTRNLDWFHVPENREAIQCCGGIGVSVDDWPEVDKLGKIIDRYDNLNSDMFSVHIVDRVNPFSRLDSVIRCAGEKGFTVVILGFKNRGRGTEFKFHPSYKSWIEVWQQLIRDRDAGWKGGYWDGITLPKLSVDTSIVQEYQDDLDKLGISRILYDKHEGRYSMYVDLVSKRAGPSSHCRDDEMVDLEDMSAESVLRAFQSFSQEE